jgi:hypothetical protein
VRNCRVCGHVVTPWRRGWRRPTTTIHEACLRARCRFCLEWFTVRKERKGLFCCNEHQASFKFYGGDWRNAA